MNTSKCPRCGGREELKCWHYSDFEGAYIIILCVECWVSFAGVFMKIIYEKLSPDFVLTHLDPYREKIPKAI